jgi:tetratricopeptide (TPR) repeat protein
MTREEWAAIHAAIGRGAFDEARRRCAAILARDPRDADAYRFDAGICLQLGDLAAALPALDACARLRPGDAEVQFLRGAARQGTGDATGAIQAYQAAIALDGGLFEARANLAMLLRRAGDVAGAIVQLEAAVVAPREVKVRLAAEPPLPRSRTVAAPAVGVSAPRVSVVAAPEKPLNSSVPPAVLVVVLALKTMVFEAADLITSDTAALARSFSVPFWMVVAPA